MYLEFLSLTQFRNHFKREFRFSPKFNLIFGNNGIGKTNVLDSIVYLSLTKSNLISKVAENIMEGKSFFRIEGHINNEKKHIISCFFSTEKKIIMHNDNPINKKTEYIGTFPSLMIHPYDLDLIREGSEMRRRLLNTYICQMNKEYLLELNKYKKALKQRNALLMRFNIENNCKWDECEPYEYIMIQSSFDIYRLRKEWCDDISDSFNEICQVMSPNHENISIHYYSQLDKENLKDLLLKYREKDVILKRTTCGIHKDDLEFKIRGKGIKKFGSLGQQKTLLLALKVAMIQLSQQKYDKYPMLLLDDLFGQLDENRIINMLEYLNGMSRTQIFIADALKPRTLPLIKSLNTDYKVFDL